MYNLAEWDLRMTNLLFHLALLLTGVVFGIMGFRLISSGFISPKSTVLFQWGKSKFQMTQVVPGVAVAMIGGTIVVAGFYFIHPQESVRPSTAAERAAFLINRLESRLENKDNEELKRDLDQIIQDAEHGKK